MNEHNTNPSSKVSVGTYGDDKLYPRVAQAVEKLLAKGNVVAPVESSGEVRDSPVKGGRA